MNLFLDQVFYFLSLYIFQIVVPKLNIFFKINKEEYESLDKLVFKQSYAGLVGFILEGGKANADPILMRFYNIQ